LSARVSYIERLKAAVFHSASTLASDCLSLSRGRASDSVRPRLRRRCNRSRLEQLATPRGPLVDSIHASWRVEALFQAVALSGLDTARQSGAATAVEVTLGCAAAFVDGARRSDALGVGCSGGDGEAGGGEDAEEEG
jgi:hypothetical protein